MPSSVLIVLYMLSKLYTAGFKLIGDKITEKYTTIKQATRDKLAKNILCLNKQRVRHRFDNTVVVIPALRNLPGIEVLYILNVIPTEQRK